MTMNNMNSDLTVNVPDPQTLISSLNNICSEAYVKEKLHPKILQLSGRKLHPTGCATALCLAVLEFTEGMPPIQRTVFEMTGKDYLGTLIPDNPDALKVAEEHWDLMQKAGRRT